MKRYAANRVLVASTQTMVRNGAVEVNESSHRVERIFELDGEIRQTEWKGGLILLCHKSPEKNVGDSFETFLRKNTISEASVDSSVYYAFHVSAFDVQAMEFTSDSRITQL